MKPKSLSLALLLIVVAGLLGPVLAACAPAPEEAVDGYTAVMPAVLRANTTQAVPVTLFNGDRQVAGKVQLALLKDGRQVASGEARISGRGTVQVAIPDVAEGDYQVQLKGNGFQAQAKVRVEQSHLVFLETDKPIYKPGQTIHMRAVTLNPDLGPAADTVTIEVLDAKGVKVFRKEVASDDYGMAALDLPLSSEPNLGVWKISAATAKSKTQVDVRVEQYVLPKYEVKVELPREWFLVSEPIKGKVVAEYSFGKPVKGDLEIKASRYVGRWEQYAAVSVPIDSEADFTVPAAGYVAGTPSAGGSGNVTLDISVVEKSTGYRESTSRLLTVSQSELSIKLIPAGSAFKPGLPFSFLVVTGTPDNTPVDAHLKARVTYLNKDFKEIRREEKPVDTVKGKALLELVPPRDAAALTVQCSGEGSQAAVSVESTYSPSGSFIHVEQLSAGTASPGQQVAFKVYSTREAANFYYEVVSRGTVVFSDFTSDDRLSFTATPAMAPSSRLLVYQILPNAEVAADYIPFKVSASYPQELKIDVGADEAGPGDEVRISVQAEGKSRVGIAAVDRSVFILAENRLNLQQVFDDLERLYMKPQAELHEVSVYQSITTRGAEDVFKNAGMVVLSNKRIPQGKEYKNENMRWFGLGGADKAIPEAARDNAVAVPAPAMAPAPTASSGLAEVQRVRQYFPETWIWQDVVTDDNGKAVLTATVPDSITTWMLRAVAMSRDKGLGVAEAQLRAFQPFFLSVDLPYSSIRGEELPVSVALYNYLDGPQSILVELQPEDWFELVEGAGQTVAVGASDVGSARFTIRPVKLGVNGLKVTARSTEAADAAIKTMIVEPEGVSREIVDNLALSAGDAKQADTWVPPFVVEGSARAYLTLTSSYLAQTIAGLEGLLQMPFGCGEQNMIVFAPDVFITRYLKASGQIKPEIMAKAEKLMLTGYQRELTYRRSDGSFSAFGQSDKEGSLWLTAFVLKSFNQARDIIFIDSAVLDSAMSWITSHQKSDGSFEAVGFVVHQEMMGGMSGKQALTAYVTAALLQSGETSASARAARYLEGQLDGMDDPYTVALTAYALELARSSRSGDAYQKLMTLAQEDEDGLHWGGSGPLPLQESQPQPKDMIARPGILPPHQPQTSQIEATGYATLALVEHGDRINAGKAAKWLVSRRNAYGGFGSTQDTVVGLEALTSYATGGRADVDLKVVVSSSGESRELKVTAQNYDVLQVVEIPVNATVDISASGKGEAIAQVVRRYNIPDAGEPEQALQIEVDYDTTEVAVNDLVKVSVDVSFNPPEPVEAGMTVIDISVPTGFAAVSESIDRAVKADARLKRYDISGRKVIFYVENMLPGDEVSFAFDVRALYPVKAKAVSSRAYSYYKPELSGETLGTGMVVVDR